MKLILIILLAVGSYYGYKSLNSAEPSKTSIAGHINSGEAVTAREVQIEAKKVAKFICNDQSFQDSIGSSVSACNKKYRDFEGMCDRRVFSNNESMVTDIATAKDLMSRYRKCATNT